MNVKTSKPDRDSTTRQDKWGLIALIVTFFHHEATALRQLTKLRRGRRGCFLCKCAEQIDRSTPGLEVSVRPGASPSPLEPAQAISAQPFPIPPERRFGKILGVRKKSLIWIKDKSKQVAHGRFLY